MAQVASQTTTTTFDKWDVIYMMADSAMNMKPLAAAEMLTNLSYHDDNTMYWVAKTIFGIDEYFAYSIFDHMAVPPLLH